MSLSLSNQWSNREKYQKDERLIIVKKNVLTTHILDLLLLDTLQLIKNYLTNKYLPKSIYRHCAVLGAIIVGFF